MKYRKFSRYVLHQKLNFTEQNLTPISNRESVNNDPCEDKMGLVDVGVLVFFGIVLPTSDVYSDLSFAMKLFLEGQLTYAYSMLAPVLASFFFMIVHWLRIESTLKKRLKSLPFLILQVWPQVQVFKIIKMGLHDKNPQWRQRKDAMEREVSSVRKNLLHVVFCRIVI